MIVKRRNSFDTVSTLRLGLEPRRSGKKIRRYDLTPPRTEKDKTNDAVSKLRLGLGEPRRSGQKFRRYDLTPPLTERYEAPKSQYSMHAVRCSVGGEARRGSCRTIGDGSAEAAERGSIFLLLSLAAGSLTRVVVSVELCVRDRCAGTISYVLQYRGPYPAACLISLLSLLTVTLNLTLKISQRSSAQ